MKLDRRFLKGVETLGAGQVERGRQLATDGYNVMLVVACDCEDLPTEGVAALTKLDAKAVLKNNPLKGDIEESPESYPTEGPVSTLMWGNMIARFVGAPDMCFVLDWDLLTKAIKALTASAGKARHQIVMQVYQRPTGCYYRLMLKGDTGAVAYVAGVEQPVLDIPEVEEYDPKTGEDDGE